MRTIRIIIGEYFQSPMGSMNFPAYFNYVNVAGKITPRSQMELETILFIAIEEQEKINKQNEEHFEQIFEILAKLVGNKDQQQEQKIELTAMPKLETVAKAFNQKMEDQGRFVCTICAKEFKAKIGLLGHQRSHKTTV